VTRLAGHAAGATASELLRFFSRSGTTGTLLLQRGDASCYMLLHDGKWLLQREVGTFGAADIPCDTFSYQLHEKSELPEARSSAPDSSIAAFRALPRTGTGQKLLHGATDLPRLLEHLRSSAFTGSLTLDQGGESSLALLLRGRIGAAFHERDSFVWQRSDALRALQRHTLQSGSGFLEVTALDAVTIHSLLGVALDSRAEGGDAAYSGVQSTDSGYVFQQRGTPYLHVRTRPTIAGVRYGLPAELPDLLLPGGAPGWEQLRYDLTLRGRDALIPMTELSMRFSEEFGRYGRQILDALLAGLNLEETAARLGSDLSDLKPWLDRLEQDGLIHARNESGLRRMDINERV
jgi:hypothetical protein